MKTAIAAVLSLTSVFAFAGENANGKHNTDRLDIAEVISIAPVQNASNVGEVVNMKMVYLDSHGATRTLNYKVLDDSRQNG
ncbi:MULTISPECIES: DUF2790 domain-containing protein [unclassified Pseudomonas]|uniref:DUF2790 domain-containing protein n=1 Tax=unclassified Pseudomonas TaxID=196821 RepID=UPI0035BEEF92